MAYGIQNVSKTQPCPICGKIDWCGWKNMGQQSERNTIICMRSDTRCNVVGVDGREYVYLWDTQGGHTRYEEKTQHDYYVAEFVKEKRKERASMNSSKSYSPALKPVKTSTTASLQFINSIEPLSNEKLDKIYRCLLSMLILEPNHKKYLVKEGFNDRLIAENCIKSFPENDSYRYKNKGKYFSRNPWRKELAKKLSERFGDLTGVPGAYKTKSGEWTFAGLGGILFPLYDEQGRIYRLRVRIDMSYTEDGTFLGKYHNFSSYKEKRENNTIYNIYECGCAANNNWGLYYHPQKDDCSICYITEGEKKGIIGNDHLNVPIASLPGVNSYMKLFEKNSQGVSLIDILKKMGVVVLVIAFDADKASNTAVLKYETATVNALREQGFIIAVANWEQSIGKGLDDLLVNGGKPVYSLYE